MTQLYFEQEINTLERSCNRSREGREENENNGSGLGKLATFTELPLDSPQAKRVSKHNPQYSEQNVRKKEQHVF